MKRPENKPSAYNGKENKINPMTGTVPIIKELQKGYLQTIGTGFYITRYGLVMTAKHVIEGLASKETKNLENSFICHIPDDKTIILRRILSVSYLSDVDIGVIQADNYLTKYPKDPLMNMRASISTKIPKAGDNLITYAYPENKVMDFTDTKNINRITGDYFEGKFIKYTENSENPSIPFSHYETTIRLRPGASGGPVFHNRKVIGINCRGWDFGENTPADQNLSYIVPIWAAFPLKIKLIQLPSISWEASQLNEYEKENEITLENLIKMGHIKIE